MVFQSPFRLPTIVIKCGRIWRDSDEVRIDDAIKEYKKAIKIEPRYAMSYYNLGGIYAQDKKYDKAIELFETSLVYSPKYTRAMMGLGDCYLEMNELDKACEWYRKAEDAGETKAFGKRIRTCK
jgi:tetratricopeptide (TPR) repeat protein